MSAPADLHAYAERARAAGASGQPSSIVRDAACAFLLEALDAADQPMPGALVAAVANSRDPLDETITASAAGRSWMVHGSVAHVPGAAKADTLLVVVRSRPFAGRDRGLRVYLIDADTPGLAVAERPSIDDDASASVTFANVQIGDERAVGPSRDATAAVDAALDRATVLVVAEMLGAAHAARRAAIEWTATRVQFGEPLANKQAVAHRVADMTLACDAVELLLADVLSAAAATGGVPDPLAVTTLKLAANRHLPTVTASAHQLHGGEGYFADRPLHRWHRRVNSLAVQYGGSRALTTRTLRLLGIGAGVKG